MSMFSYSRICVLGFLVVIVVIVVVVSVADPSVECEGNIMCEGPQSVCIDDYCQCQEDFPQGWRCARRYLGFQYYRGYGSPYSGILLVGIFLLACLACWWDPFGKVPPRTNLARRRVGKVWFVERNAPESRADAPGSRCKLKCAHMI